VYIDSEIKKLEKRISRQASFVASFKGGQSSTFSCHATDKEEEVMLYFH
jgi:hypothetical protein